MVDSLPSRSTRIRTHLTDSTKLGRCCPDFADFIATFSRCRPNLGVFGKLWAVSDRMLPDSTKLRPNSVGFRPATTNFCWLQPTSEVPVISTKISAESLKRIRQTRPTLDRNRPNFGRYRPRLASMLSDFGRNRPMIGTRSANFGPSPSSTKLGRI